MGSTIEQALSLVGITSARIEAWLGRPCNCKERIEKLNSLGYWARRVIKGKVDRAAEYLEAILSS